MDCKWTYILDTDTNIINVTNFDMAMALLNFAGKVTFKGIVERNAFRAF